MARESASARGGTASSTGMHVANFKAIVALFAVWKILILLVVSVSPGPGYDTSATILLGSEEAHGDPHYGPVSNILAHCLTRLLRWDAFYFVAVARRDYLFEQEWAFGWGFTRTVSTIAQVLPESLLRDSVLREVLAGVILSHVSHLLCCFFIYALTLRLLPAGTQHRGGIATLAACLHILSPAGVFLSAPCTEGPFACLNVLGFLLLTFAAEPPASIAAAVVYKLSAMGGGLCFALSSTVRGNGLLSVVALGIHGLPMVRRILGGSITIKDLFGLAASAAAVLLSMVGFAAPQYLAYTLYCSSNVLEQRPWCSNTLPSIYTFVQQHYWNNGFLKYWTIPNSPLFAIAAPVLWLLARTAWIYLQPFVLSLKHTKPVSRKVTSAAATAAPQLVLAVLAFTSFHVQITNRISSGYPTWFIALATAIAGSSQDGVMRLSDLSFLGSRKVLGRIVKGMMMYSLIQAGLFASFLPPA